MIRRLLASLAFVALASVPARADLLVLDYQGVTLGSTLAGNAIADGTSLEIQTVFDTSSGMPITQGAYVYAASQITVNVGGTLYSESNPGSWSVLLVDPTNPQYMGYNIPALGGNGLFAPFYTTATPTFDASNPVPTTFSGYLGAIGGGGTFSTASGDLLVAFDGVNAAWNSSIRAVPEPSTLALVGLGGLILRGVRRVVAGASGSEDAGSSCRRFGVSQHGAPLAPCWRFERTCPRPRPVVAVQTVVAKCFMEAECSPRR